MDLDKLIQIGILEFAKEVIFDDDGDSLSDEEFLVVTELASLPEERVCIKEYMEKIVPLYCESDFKIHFRMGRSTFEKLLGENFSIW